MYVKIDEPLSFELLDSLLGQTIRFRWPDQWGEAFPTGMLAAYEENEIEGQPSVLIEIHSGEAIAGRILPLGIEVDLWLVVEDDFELDLGEL